ncbi:hypothetical protein FS837_000194 [Tulasnella sp. UAMH 9824]|nr:hypothetical protein FS837_000194 [Tulasnella sp. UAMH 9824]
MRSSDHPSSAQDTSAEEIRSAQDLTADPISAEASAPSSSRQDGKNSVRTGNLAVAKKTFQSIDAVSWVLPVVGTYTGVLAKVGLAVVHVAETMEKNQDITKDLESGISKLSEIVEKFEARSDKQQEDEIATSIQELKKEIESLQKRVQKWESSGRLAKTIAAMDPREALNDCINTVHTALAQLQS